MNDAESTLTILGKTDQFSILVKWNSALEFEGPIRLVSLEVNQRQ
jgi:hypothetical protein